MIPKRTLTVLMLLGVLLASTGCEKIQNEDFGGIFGAVGYPAIRYCDVEIYEATKFIDLGSSTGRIAKTRTDGAGRFAVEIADAHLGRPVIVVARPGPTAEYLDYGAVGNPWVPFDGDREPWVAVVAQFLGGDDLVTVSPITTLAFHSLMRQPVGEVGPGSLRFDSAIVNATNAAAGTAFGVKANPAEELAAPPQGPGFPALSVREFARTDRSTALSYATLQLAVAANDFATLTVDGTDGALEFYDALFEDARDGVLDGRVHGADVPYLAQAGAPAVLGLDGDGSSALLEYLASLPLNALDEAAAKAATGGFDPSVADILTNQTESTGSLRSTRIDWFDVQNFPESGNVVLTVRGDGFRHTDRFVFRSFDNEDGEFFVDRDSVGVDGEFQFHSSTELRLRIPDFALTTKTVHASLQVASGLDFRRIRFLIENLPEIASGARDLETIVTDDARLTDRTEPLLVSVEIGRLDTAGRIDPVGFGNNVYPGTQDPAALVAGTDDAYVLRVRVANPGPDIIDNFGLDLTLSTFEQTAVPVVVDTFGGSAANRALILEATPASIVTFNPGDVTTMTYPFLFLSSAFPVDIVFGVPVTIVPAFSGINQTTTLTVSTVDVTGFERTVSIGPADPAQTSELAALSPATLPGSVSAGASLQARLSFSAAPRVPGTMRDGRVVSVDVTITFDGATFTWRLRDDFFYTRGPKDLVATGWLLDSTGGQALPLTLTQVAGSDDILLTIQTGATVTGTLDLTFSANFRESSTGTLTTGTAASASTTIS